MKHCYPKVPVFLALFTLLYYLPPSVQAQCLCADGSAATTTEHVVSTTFSSNNTTILSMPKFDPAVGTLVCVNAKVFLTSVLRMRLENDEEFPIDYVVKYVRTDTFSGPGINPPVTGGANKNYGPYSLDGTDWVPFSGPDYIFIGPDTIYNMKLYETTTSDVVDYLGTGTVDFAYKSVVNTFAIGSDVYALSVSSQNSVQFRVTYSYCNLSVLPLKFLGFNAVLKDRDVLLEWTATNEKNSNSYEIQVSVNGAPFEAIGTMPSRPSAGTASKYNFKYSPDKPVNGTLRFRIVQSDGSQLKYSDIRTVQIDRGLSAGLRLYPNPVVRNLNLEFDQPLNGEFTVDITSMTGQRVFTRKANAVHNTSIQLLINNPPPPGIYLVRATEIATGKTYSSRLLFRR